MRVEIWSDLVCPWCYIGKRRFELALAGETGATGATGVHIVHRSFQLDPTMPRGKAFDQGEVLARKYGLSPEQAAAMRKRMVSLAADEGLLFNPASGITGNTLDGHRLVHLAADRG